jgi:hypothetical protein
MESTEKETGTGLCWRCENRSVFHETGYGPRYECKQDRAVNGCYCFIPCKPIVVGPIEGEKRPIFAGWLFAGRIRSYALVDDKRLRLKLIDMGDGKASAVWTITKPKSVTNCHRLKKEKA